MDLEQASDEILIVSQKKNITGMTKRCLLRDIKNENLWTASYKNNFLSLKMTKRYSF
jgi:hypothetical protein